MKKAFSIVIMILLMFTATCGCRQERNFAKIDDVYITQQDFDYKRMMVLSQHEDYAETVENAEIYSADLTDDAILSELVLNEVKYQEALKMGCEATQSQMEGGFEGYIEYYYNDSFPVYKRYREEFMKKYSMDDSEFREYAYEKYSRSVTISNAEIESYQKCIDSSPDMCEHMAWEYFSNYVETLVLTGEYNIEWYLD